MPRKQTYQINLLTPEQDYLINLVSTGEEKARKLTHGRILIKANEGWTDDQIADALNIGRATAERTRKRYVEEGLDIALNGRRSKREYQRKIDGKNEAHLVALVCGEPPEGYSGWTLRLLSERFVKLEQVDIETVSHETVRQVLKKTSSSLGRTSSG